MLKFRPRMTVLAADRDWIALYANRALAQSLLADGRVTVEEKDERKHVKTLRLVAGSVDVRLLRLRPGSFGIERIRVAPGANGKSAGLIYKHRDLHELELAA